MNKLYNIGVTRMTPEGFEEIGYHTIAKDADAAYRRVREHCDAVGIILMEGHTAQRRDPNGGNEYFDRAFKLMHAADEILA
jgi:hypothetical protein